MDSNHFDFTILGTNLSLSILSSSLSRAGFKVLHLDQNRFYGQRFASLNLIDLKDHLRLQTTKVAESTTSKRYTNLHLEFPAFHSTANQDDDDIPIPELLSSLSRHFSISLTPLLIPSEGPFLEDLIKSKVNDYSTFRLLGQTLIYSKTTTPTPPSTSTTASTTISSGRTTDDSKAKSKETPLALGSLTKVPSSKSDVFASKSISLMDKRKLMKILLAIVNENEWEKAFGRLHPKVERKLSEVEKKHRESIFDSNNSTGLSLPGFLQKKYKLSQELLDAISFAIGLCPSDSMYDFSSNPESMINSSTSTPSCTSSNPPLLSSLLQAQNHLKSLGKYGDSPFLVSQYGGSSEILEGFNRNSAVFGGVYVVGREIERIERIKKGEKKKKKSEEGISVLEDENMKEENEESIYQIRIKDIDELFTSNWLISSDETKEIEGLDVGSLIGEKQKIGPSEPEVEVKEFNSKPQVDLVRGILILDRCLPIGEFSRYLNLETSTLKNEDEEQKVRSQDQSLPPETALIVFPPGSLADQHAKDGQENFSTTVLMMGEGTFSCPKGMYVYYLSTFASSSLTSSSIPTPKDILSKVTRKLLDFSNHCPQEFKSEPQLNIQEVKPLMEIYYREKLLSTSSTSIPIEVQLASNFLQLSNSSQNLSSRSNSVLELPNLPSETTNSSTLAQQLFYAVQGLSPTEALDWAMNGRPEEFKPKKSNGDGERDLKRRSSEWNGRAGRGWDDPIEEARREKWEKERLMREELESNGEEGKDEELEKRRNIKEWFATLEKEDGEGEDDED